MKLPEQRENNHSNGVSKYKLYWGSIFRIIRLLVSLDYANFRPHSLPPQWDYEFCAAENCRIIICIWNTSLRLPVISSPVDSQTTYNRQIIPRCLIVKTERSCHNTQLSRRPNPGMLGGGGFLIMDRLRGPRSKRTFKEPHSTTVLCARECPWRL